MQLIAHSLQTDSKVMDINDIRKSGFVLHVHLRPQETARNARLPRQTELWEKMLVYVVK